MDDKETMVNIFFTDSNPVIAARDSCDSYVVKIPIEVALLLSAIHWRTGYDGPVSSGMPVEIVDGEVVPAAGPYRDSRVIKSTSETYRWLVKSRGNYEYAIAYGMALIDEHRRRYGSTHNTSGVLLWLKHNVPDIPPGSITRDVGLAMPNEYKNRNDVIGSYRKYIMLAKSSVTSWKHGQVPDWFLFAYTDGQRSEPERHHIQSKMGCGAASGNGTHPINRLDVGCRASYAVWFGEDDPRNFSGLVIAEPSNQAAELTAIRKALEILKDDPRPHVIVTDSQYGISCLTEWIHNWKTNGWRTSGGKPVKHRKIIEEAAGMIENNTFMHVRSHAREPSDRSSAAWMHWHGNMQADRMAVQVLNT